MFLPNVSRLSNVLTMMLATQFLTVFFWLVADQALSIIVLGLWTLYAQWAVLLTACAVGWATKFVAKLNVWLGSLMVIGIAVSSLYFVEMGVQFFQSGGAALLPDTHRFIRFGLAYSLLVVIFLRASHFIGHAQNLDRAEAESRISALQARIQPHFLFNSLNTIAELTATSPAKAESAIESLSMLFRVSLEDRRNQHSLQKEINLCERYGQLEAYRHESDLFIEWSISVDEPEKWLVPKLILQPLIENAIKYSPRASSVPSIINVSIRELTSSLSLKVENKIADELPLASGNGVALQNIKDRLVALYDDKQSLKLSSREGSYQVVIKMPKQV